MYDPSSTGGVMAVPAIHGGGSTIIEKIAIVSQYEIKARKKMVKFLGTTKY